MKLCIYFVNIFYLAFSIDLTNRTSIGPLAVANGISIQVTDFLMVLVTNWLLYHHPLRWSLAVFPPYTDERFWPMFDESESTQIYLREGETVLHTVLENCPGIVCTLNYTARELPVLLGEDFKYWACVRTYDRDWVPLAIKDAVVSGDIRKFFSAKFFLK